MAKLDYTWFEHAVGTQGLALAVPTADIRTATGTTAGFAWTVVAERTITSDSPDSFTTIFEAPWAACPTVGPDELRAGVAPKYVNIRRNDAMLTGAGGDVVSSALVAALLVWRRRRKDLATAPSERLDVDTNPPGVLSQRLIEHLAVWPGDAAFSQSLEAKPTSAALAQTPDGAFQCSVTVSTSAALRMWTNTWGNESQLHHAITAWKALIEELTAARVIVARDPVTITPPTREEIASATDALRDQLRQIKAAKKAAKKQRN